MTEKELTVYKKKYAKLIAVVGINDCKGKVFFINWDKINKSSNTVLREGENFYCKLNLRKNFHPGALLIFFFIYI